MSIIKVQPEDIKKNAVSMQQIARELKNYDSQVAGVHSGLRMKILASEQIDKRLRETRDQLIQEAARMDSFAEAMIHIAEKYSETELKVLETLVANKQIPAIDAAVIAQQLLEKWDHIVEHYIEPGAEKLRELWERFKEDCRYTLVTWGIIKAEKQEVAEGETATIRQQKEQDLYMQQQIDKVLKDSRFSKDTWKKASVEERKKILQEYIDNINGILGLPAKTINFFSAEAQNGKITMGSYSPDNNSININEWVIANRDAASYSLLSTVVHEMRHYYQHEAIKNPDSFVVAPETIKKWDDSFKNYKSTNEFRAGGMSEEDAYNAYRNQEVEVDARRFAKQK